MVSDDILQDKNSDQNDLLFEELPTCPVKRQIIKPNTRLELAANKIKKNTTDKEIEKNLKTANARVAKWLKKSGYLDSSDLQIIDYNNDVDITVLETVDYKNDIQLDDLDDSVKVISDIDRTNLKKTSKSQITVKKSIEKYKKINESKLNYYAKLNKTNKNDVIKSNFSSL